MTSAAGELRASRTFGLKATPRTPTLAPLSAALAVVERLGDEVDDVARHREVDVAGELDEAVDEVELARAPRQVVRIDRDAVPADAGPGRELHEPERLGRRGVDDLPDVEAHPLAQQRELVDERDVDVAEDVLEELRELGRVGRRQLDDLVVDVAQQRGGPRRRPAAWSPRRGAGRPSRRWPDRPG